jgi:hypothetical protein
VRSKWGVGGACRLTTACMHARTHSVKHACSHSYSMHARIARIACSMHARIVSALLEAAFWLRKSDKP